MADDDVAAVKRCSKCGESKPANLEHFGWIKAGHGRNAHWASWCRPCVAARVRQYKANNPEKAAASKKASDERNKDKIRSRKRQYDIDNKDKLRATRRIWEKKNNAVIREKRAVWRAENREKIAAYHEEWLAAHPDHRGEVQRRYYAKHSERIQAYLAEYHRQNPEVGRCSVRNRRARMKAAGGTHGPKDVAAQLNLQSGLCYWCDATLEKYEVDHFIPIARGGTNGPENIVISCGPCNRLKNMKMPDDFIRLLASMKDQT